MKILKDMAYQNIFSHNNTDVSDQYDIVVFLMNILCNCSTIFMRHLKGNYMNSMWFLNGISVNEVAHEITKFNLKKGFGIDGIRPKEC